MACVGACPRFSTYFFVWACTGSPTRFTTSLYCMFALPRLNGRRLSLGIALLCGSSIVLLDEPTTGLGSCTACAVCVACGWVRVWVRLAAPHRCCPSLLALLALPSPCIMPCESVSAHIVSCFLTQIQPHGVPFGTSSTRNDLQAGPSSSRRTTWRRYVCGVGGHECVARQNLAAFLRLGPEPNPCIALLVFWVRLSCVPRQVDALCNRIGIMTHGSLKCIGTPQHLKDRFGACGDVCARRCRDHVLSRSLLFLRVTTRGTTGGGYQISLTLIQESDKDRAEQFMLSTVCATATLTDHIGTRCALRTVACRCRAAQRLGLTCPFAWCVVCWCGRACACAASSLSSPNPISASAMHLHAWRWPSARLSFESGGCSKRLSRRCLSRSSRWMMRVRQPQTQHE